MRDMREENALSLSRLSKRRGGDERGDEKSERERDQSSFQRYDVFYFCYEERAFVLRPSPRVVSDQRFLRRAPDLRYVSKVFKVFDGRHHKEPHEFEYSWHLQQRVQLSRILKRARTDVVF